MTNQEIFNRVWVYFSVPRQKSMDQFGNCLYDDGNGGGCAIGGPLLTKKERAMVWAGQLNSGVSASGLIKRLPQLRIAKARPAEKFPRGDFLNALQNCHDAPINGEDFSTRVRQGLKLIAKRWNLTVPGDH